VVRATSSGDFGSGKSHFLAALYSWLSGKAGRGPIVRDLSGRGAASGRKQRVLAAAVSLIGYRAETRSRRSSWKSGTRLCGGRREVKLSPVSVFLSRCGTSSGCRMRAQAFLKLVAGSVPSITESGRDSLCGSRQPSPGVLLRVQLFKDQGFDAPGAIVEDRRKRSPASSTSSALPVSPGSCS